MRNRTCISCTLSAALAYCCATSVATAAFTTTTWTFETSQPAVDNTTTIGPIAAEIGSGTASGVHASALTDYSSPAGNGSMQSFSSNNWGVGDYYQFLVDPTGGGSSFAISWDQTSSATGPASFDLQYSTTGGTFTTLVSGYAVPVNGSPNTAWNMTTSSSVYHFSATVTDNLISSTSTLYFRMVDSSTTSENGGTVGTAGTDRVDNVTISAATVPEAGTWLTVGGPLGLYALVSYRRRRRVT